MIKQIYRILSCTILLSISSWVQGAIIPIDLNDFVAGYTVDVSLSGNSAAITEDTVISFAILENDPFLGDPEVIIAASQRSLMFSYDFIEASGNDDVFSAELFDADSGFELYFFELESSAVGTVLFDLSSLIGTTLGLRFRLDDFDSLSGGVDSLVTISDLRLVDPDTVSVPEPSTLSILALGFLFSLGISRRKRFNS